MNVITCTPTMDYLELFQELEKRFAPFQDTEKERLLNEWFALSIQPNQLFRNFWGKSQEIVHNLQHHHHVGIDNTCLYHKLRTNLHATLRTYYFTIRNESLSPDDMAQKLIAFEEAVSRSGGHVVNVPNSIYHISETSDQPTKFKGRCHNCGQWRHKAKDCPNPPRKKNGQKTENSNSNSSNFKGDQKNGQNVNSNSKEGPKERCFH